jgi:hypothetical protein
LQLASRGILGSFFDPEDGGDMFLRNVGLQGDISLKIGFFIATIVKTSNPTKSMKFGWPLAEK